jgi:hypothetical protein
MLESPAQPCASPLILKAARPWHSISFFLISSRYIIHILWKNGGIGELLTNDGKSVLDFVFDLLAILLPIDCSQPSCFQLGVSMVKALRLILLWWLDLVVGLCDAGIPVDLDRIVHDVVHGPETS